MQAEKNGVQFACIELTPRISQYANFIVILNDFPIATAAGHDFHSSVSGNGWEVEVDSTGLFVQQVRGATEGGGVNS